MATDLVEALHRLEDVLVRSGAAIAPTLRPGIADSDIRAALATLGLEPSAEVVTWFNWHDGAGEPGMPSETIHLVPGGELYPLEYFVGQYVEARTIAVDVAAVRGSVLTADDLWRASWFPFLRLFGKGHLAADLAGGDGSGAPVHVVWFDADPADAARAAWPTLTAFVEAVVGRFEDGVYAVDSDGIVVGPTIDVPFRGEDR